MAADAAEWPKLQRMPLAVTATTDTHYVVTAGIPLPLRQELVDQFSVAQRHNPFVRVQPRPLELAEDTPSGLRLPRAAGEQLFGKAPRAPTWQDGAPLGARMLLQLRPQQEAAVSEVVAVLGETDQVLLQAVCGAGKTTTALGIAVRLNVRALVLVHTSVLLKQWQERVRTTCTASVTVVQGAKTDCSGDIVIAMQQTLARATREVDLSKFGLVIWDEAHHSPCNMLRLANRAPTRLLGLSATPRREDGTTAALYYMFGTRVVMTAERPPVNIYWRRMPSADVRMGRVDGRPLVTQARRRLAEHPVRQTAVLSLLRDLRARGRRVLALTDFVSHVESTAADVDGVAVHGKSKEVDVESAIARGQCIVSTHSLVKEGVDWGGLDTLVFLLPPAVGSVEQETGRLRPRQDADYEPWVFDLTDVAIDSRRRALAYKQLGFVQHDED